MTVSVLPKHEVKPHLFKHNYIPLNLIKKSKHWISNKESLNILLAQQIQWSFPEFLPQMWFEQNVANIWISLISHLPAPRQLWGSGVGTGPEIPLFECNALTDCITVLSNRLQISLVMLSESVRINWLLFSLKSPWE